MNQPWLRRALSIGTGAGIVIGERDLEVVLARVRPDGIRLLATLRIEEFRERPAAEWGAEYARLLQRNAASHKAAIAVLPRHEVIVRTVHLPGVNDQDAGAAIRFQLDTLHPYAEEDVACDWQRIGGGAHFVVLIALRRIVDLYTALFAEAGIRLAGFTFSGGAVFPALRLSGAPEASDVLAVRGLASGAGGPVELYGESESRPLFSAEFDLPLERALSLSAAELRLPDEVEPRDLADVLPPWKFAAEEVDLSPQAISRRALAYAASLAAACPHLGAPPNLLAVENRAPSSRIVYLPTAALAIFLLLMGAGLMAQGPFLDRAYLRQLEAEVQQLQPAARRVEAVEKETVELVDRIRLLDDYRRQPKHDLDTLLEVNRLVPPPGWVQQLQVARDSVQVSGEAEQAEELLKKFDASPAFAASEFTMPLTKGAQGETFRLKARREAPRQ